MYNKKMLEYRDVDSEDYNNYSENALFLLKVIQIGLLYLFPK